MSLPQETDRAGHLLAQLVAVDLVADEGGRLDSRRCAASWMVLREKVSSKLRLPPGLLATSALAVRPASRSKLLPGQHQGHDRAILMEQSAGGEGERPIATRRQRLHLDVRILVAGDGIGPMPDRDRAQIGHEQQRIDVPQRSRRKRRLDELARHWRPWRRSAAVRRAFAVRSREPAPTCRPGPRVVGRVGDNHVFDGFAPSEMFLIGQGDAAFALEIDVFHARAAPSDFRPCR